MDLALIPDGGLAWLEASGPLAHVVLSTRIRLARNLEHAVFAGRASSDDRRRVLEAVDAAWQRCASARGGSRILLDDLDGGERQVLHERHLVSKELMASADGRPGRSASALFLAGSLGVMVNEEDHLRLQTLQSGFALQPAYAALDRLDGELGAVLRFAFHREFGYLTACPTNAGTGLRASVLIHLPGLVLTKEISKVLQGLAQVGLTFRGLYGEGSEVVGNFFQLSNQTTLGKSEEELLDHLGKIVRQVVEYEEQARQVLLRDRGQGVARVRTAPARPQPVLRGVDEPVVGCAVGSGAETDPRAECIYAQQAPDLHAVRPPGRARSAVSQRYGIARDARGICASHAG